jgi:hypothetical protein
MIPIYIDAGRLYRIIAAASDAQENSRQRRNSCIAGRWRARSAQPSQARFARRCRVSIDAIVLDGGAGSRERI